MKHFEFMENALYSTSVTIVTTVEGINQAAVQGRLILFIIFGPMADYLQVKNRKTTFSYIVGQKSAFLRLAQSQNNCKTVPVLPS